MPERLLEVKGLKVRFATEDGVVHAVDGVDFELDRGKVLGIVGESGSGKSVTVQTILGLTRAPNAHIEGSVKLGELELTEAGEDELRQVRGARVAMVFQDPISSLNPVYRVGDQIAEAIRAHRPLGKREAKARTVEALIEAIGAALRSVTPADIRGWFAHSGYGSAGSSGRANGKPD